MDNDKFYVDLDEAFEWGRLVGQKEAFQDIIDLIMQDSVSARKWAIIRLQALDTATSIIRTSKGE